MKVERVELAAIKANKANPRVCRDAKFKKLVDSILAFPKMMEARPIVVNGEMVVLGGNQRLKALQTIKGMDIAEVRGRITRQSDFASKSKAEQDEILSYWAVWLDKPIVSIVNAKEFSDSEQKQFIIKDNASAGEWDFVALSKGYDSTVLNEWSIDVPLFYIPPQRLSGQPLQNEPLQNEPLQNEPLQNEPLQNEPLQNEPLQNEPLQNEPLQNEPLQNEPLQNEPLQNEPLQTIEIGGDVGEGSENAMSKNVDNIKIGTYHIEYTPEEFKEFIAILRQYSEERGTIVGFMSFLIEKCKE